jgi:hypothetical protein
MSYKDKGKNIKRMIIRVRTKMKIMKNSIKMERERMKVK